MEDERVLDEVFASQAAAERWAAECRESSGFVSVPEYLDFPGQATRSWCRFYVEEAVVRADREHAEWEGRMAALEPFGEAWRVEQAEQRGGSW